MELLAKTRLIATGLFGTWQRLLLTLIIASLLSLVGLVAFRSVVRVKNMVDAGSLGFESLVLAHSRGVPGRGTPALIDASAHFARLDQALNHWSWFIAMSEVVPPVSRQFDSMRTISDAGHVVVAAGSELSVPTSDGALAPESVQALCSARAELSDVDQRSYFQLVKTANDLILVIDQFLTTPCE